MHKTRRPTMPCFVATFLCAFSLTSPAPGQATDGTPDSNQNPFANGQSDNAAASDDLPTIDLGMERPLLLPSRSGKHLLAAKMLLKKDANKEENRRYDLQLAVIDVERWIVLGRRTFREHSGRIEMGDEYVYRLDQKERKLEAFRIADLSLATSIDVGKMCGEVGSDASAMFRVLRLANVGEAFIHVNVFVKDLKYDFQYFDFRLDPTTLKRAPNWSAINPGDGKSTVSNLQGMWFFDDTLYSDRMEPQLFSHFGIMGVRQILTGRDHWNENQRRRSNYEIRSQVDTEYHCHEGAFCVSAISEELAAAKLKKAEVDEYNVSLILTREADLTPLATQWLGVPRSSRFTYAGPGQQSSQLKMWEATRRLHRQAMSTPLLPISLTANRTRAFAAIDDSLKRWDLDPSALQTIADDRQDSTVSDDPSKNRVRLKQSTFVVDYGQPFTLSYELESGGWPDDHRFGVATDILGDYRVERSGKILKLHFTSEATINIKPVQFYTGESPPPLANRLIDNLSPGMGVFPCSITITHPSLGGRLRHAFFVRIDEATYQELVARDPERYQPKPRVPQVAAANPTATSFEDRQAKLNRSIVYLFKGALLGPISLGVMIGISILIRNAMRR